MRLRIETILSFVVICLVMVCTVQAQKPSLRQYTVEDGLPSSEVYHVFQDSKGYIWMATNLGVSRFDGTNFRTFDMSDGLPQNTVFEIYEDDGGRVWFISFPFNLSYYQNGVIHKYKYNSVIEQIAFHGKVPHKMNFRADKEGNIWFSLINSGYIHMVDHKGKVTNYPSTEEAGVYLSVTEMDGQLLTLQNARWKQSNTISIKTKLNNNIVKLPVYYSDYSGGFFILDSDKWGNIYLSQNEFLYTIHPDGSFNVKKFDKRLIWIHNQDDQYLWIGFEVDGVMVYNINEMSNGPIDTFLAGQSVTSVLNDSEGGLWFSTSSSGVFYLPSQAFFSYTMEEGLSGNNVNELAIFKDKLYLTADDGYTLDVIDYDGVRQVNKLLDGNNKIRALKTYKDSCLFIGTEHFLYYYDGEKVKAFVNNHPYLIKESAPLENFRYGIMDIYPVTGSDILMGLTQSLMQIKGGNVIYESSIDDSLSIRVEAISQTKDKKFLLASTNGLWTFDDSGFHYLGNDNPLFKERITSIAVFPNSNDFVLGTKGAGLIISTNNKIYRLTNHDGLTSNSITTLHISGNELWVGTNNGINVLPISDLLKNRPHPSVIIFRKQHGIISNEINKIIGTESYIVIGTNKGLTIFSRSKFKPIARPPKIFIESISVMMKDTILQKSYSLKHDENFVKIKFAGIAFRDADAISYKYRLLGLNSGWNSTLNNELEFAFLPPGKYRFEVLAVNSVGMVSSYPACIEIIIRPPFWVTWWFNASVLLLIILLAILAYSHTTYRQKKRHLLEVDSNLDRQQALIRQMDPHFVFNTLNSIQSYIIKNDHMSSSLYLSKFSRLMRLILNNSQKPMVKLKDEISALNLYLEIECMRFQQKFEYNISWDDSITPEVSYIPAFMIQPFVENAIWHGIMNSERPGVIKIRFERDPIDYDIIICTIEDNGIGRDLSKKVRAGLLVNKSLGIINVEKRLNLLSSLHNKKMSLNFTDLVENGEPRGTIVTISIPLQGRS